MRNIVKTNNVYLYTYCNMWWGIDIEYTIHRSDRKQLV